MGGDPNIKELNNLLTKIKSQNLKTCVYSGYNKTDIFDLTLFDYLKIGYFDKNKGGLDNTNTNQKFYQIENVKLIDKNNISPNNQRRYTFE